MTDVLIAPFALADEVHPKAHIGMPIQANYKITALKLDRDGWHLQLEGLSIGDHGWHPAEDFETVHAAYRQLDKAVEAFKAL